MRNSLYLPSAISFIIAIINLFSDNPLGAALWFLASAIFLVVFVPIIIDVDEKAVPTFQIFAILFLFLIFFFIISTIDIAKFNLGLGKSILLGFLSSLAMIAIVMVLKGKD